MLGSTPAFPAFEDWQKMSEAEQDALIGRLEAARRRQRGLLRLFLGLAGAIVTAGLGAAAVYLQLAN